MNCMSKFIFAVMACSYYASGMVIKTEIKFIVTEVAIDMCSESCFTYNWKIAENVSKILDK